MVEKNEICWFKCWLRTIQRYKGNLMRLFNVHILICVTIKDIQSDL